MGFLSTMMRRFSIRFRMNGAIALVLALFALVGLTGLFAGQHLQELNTEFMGHSVKEAQNVSDIRAGLGDIRRHEKDMVIHYEDSKAVTGHRELWSKAIDRTSSAFEAMLAGEDDEDNQLARDAIGRLKAYRSSSEATVRNIELGVYDSAITVDRVLDRAKMEIHAVEQAVHKIDAIVQAEAESTKAEFGVSMRRATWAFLIVLVVVVLLVVPLTLMNSRSIVQPLLQARSIAQSIAAGDLGSRVEVVGQDETSDLMRALLEMQQSLRSMVGEIRTTSESMSMASSEIATGNQDLSGRTEQTASALQQTASSMEQLTGTVRQTADSASTANQLASSAAQAARKGGAVVSQVVTNMEEITTSSRRIAEIIGVIDGIAFQTNILALNAAVEAARAGEQGRGFAVVAGEVRNLAQRSANAAREIKSLINASVEKVESGSKLVQDAGVTMNEIVSGVQRVSDIIGEITAAATEQSNELGQVNMAVTQLDQMTQQNAALVEQSAAAAQSMTDQARRLTEMISTFRGAEDQAHPFGHTHAAPVARAVSHRPAAPAAVIADRPAAPAFAPAPAPVPAPAPAARSSSGSAATAPVGDDWETF
ncbi:methyl-accepting chemotaxis protein [Sphaerotilus hippei]|uniref:Methyl-accepting chemotaxis protein n=1 Tax=Sphaerotilus hippei TaxID=744406 RepID=A0A318H1A9_9BURK|nr:methyl-accepting chemotaxis protein [Sphaerotilus hippei]PXW96165.1 methyl-accepting chemotaxis protein [Sphaerotilus hippei]